MVKDELWMKHKAAKSFGGKCMSKFVQDSERKRVQRLKNIKSSVASSSFRNHDSWTRSKVEQRQRELRLMKKKKERFLENKKDESIKFQIRSFVTESTKSGLKLKLKPDETDLHERKKETRADNKRNTKHDRFERKEPPSNTSTPPAEEWRGEKLQYQNQCDKVVPTSSSLSSLSFNDNDYIEEDCHKNEDSGESKENSQSNTVSLSAPTCASWFDDVDSSSSSSSSLQENESIFREADGHNSIRTLSNDDMVSYSTEDSDDIYNGSISSTDPTAKKRNEDKSVLMKENTLAKSSPSGCNRGVDEIIKSAEKMTVTERVSKNKNEKGKPTSNPIPFKTGKYSKKVSNMVKKSDYKRRINKNTSKIGLKGNKNSKKPYIGPGVSIEALTKEREEALAILNDLERHESNSQKNSLHMKGHEFFESNNAQNDNDESRKDSFGGTNSSMRHFDIENSYNFDKTSMARAQNTEDEPEVSFSTDDYSASFDSVNSCLDDNSYQE